MLGTLKSNENYTIVQLAHMAFCDPVMLCVGHLGSFHIATILMSNIDIDDLRCIRNFSLIVPFLRFGEVISGGPHFPLTSDALKKVLTGHASREVMLSVAHAVGATVTLDILVHLS